MVRNLISIGQLALVLGILLQSSVLADDDFLKDLQSTAAQHNRANWGHWGTSKNRYAGWSHHSNRLIPIYTYGIELSDFKGKNSPYRDASRLNHLYGHVPPKTLNARAEYFDQTDVYRLQRDAVNSGKRYVVLIVLDGMDWQLANAAAIYKTRSIAYSSGRGNGLSFQDYQGAKSDFGFFVTSPHNTGTMVDVDGQYVQNPGGIAQGGYFAGLGGDTPWSKRANAHYLIGRHRRYSHVTTDSAASATSMTSGIKTYNGAINVNVYGQQVVPLSRVLQSRGLGIGIVTSVPISHATTAAAYANNVTRADYQDLSRDLLGLHSVSHRENPLPGVDVLIGAGWGENAGTDIGQGYNFQRGNRYLTQSDFRRIQIENGGNYVVATRTNGQPGHAVLMNATWNATRAGARLFGYFGARGGHLPYKTADGNCDSLSQSLSPADIVENPSLAQMTQAALTVLSTNRNGFWLMVEAGDVDWAAHSNNIDDAIGATLSGDAAFRAVTDWIEKNDVWEESAVIVTADHGHSFTLDRPKALTGPAHPSKDVNATGPKTIGSKTTIRNQQFAVLPK